MVFIKLSCGAAYCRAAIFNHTDFTAFKGLQNYHFRRRLSLAALNSGAGCVSKT